MQKDDIIACSVTRYCVNDGFQVHAAWVGPLSCLTILFVACLVHCCGFPSGSWEVLRFFPYHVSMFCRMPTDFFVAGEECSIALIKQCVQPVPCNCLHVQCCNSLSIPLAYSLSMYVRHVYGFVML